MTLQASPLDDPQQALDGVALAEADDDARSLGLQQVDHHAVVRGVVLLVGHVVLRGDADVGLGQHLVELDHAARAVVTCTGAMYALQNVT